MEKLKAYLSERSMTQSQFGTAVGRRQHHISKICAGKIKPTLELALRIARITDGAVPVEAWASET